jgi:hypothetical protein
MTTIQLRQQLHDYINRAEQKKLKAIYTMVEEEVTATSLLTPAHKAELDERLEEYLAGKGKNFTWNETVKHIKTQAKRSTAK